eukprot:185262_1
MANPNQEDHYSQQVQNVLLGAFLSNSPLTEPTQSSSSRSRSTCQRALKEDLQDVVIDQKILDKTKSCSICTTDYQIDDDAKKLPCKHIFHDDCILQWLSRHNTCPLCRDELETLNYDYEQQRRAKDTSRSSVDRSFMYT